VLVVTSSPASSSRSEEEPSEAESDRSGEETTEAAVSVSMSERAVLALALELGRLSSDESRARLVNGELSRGGEPSEEEDARG
jgi:hypothetical protein